MGEVGEGMPPEVVIAINVSRDTSFPNASDMQGNLDGHHPQVRSEFNPQDAWLPITESRDGNIYTCVFHLVSSGIGIQALLLPVAFASLGRSWGIICLSLVFSWQLYTIRLLVQLHESADVAGPRYSRYLQLAMAAFGPKIGKLLALFPVMYLSGGTCVVLIITGGSTMELLFNTLTGEAESLTGAEWFLVFTCVAIALAQRPNLNSISGYSLIGAITSILYCTLTWALSIYKGSSPGDVSSSDMLKGRQSHEARMRDILNALGIIALAFRGHNLVLEIQGTLPSSPKVPSRKPMWKGVTISYMFIAMCLFPLAIAGFCAYGSKVPYKGGLLSVFMELNSHNTSKFTKALVYSLVVISCLCQFQIYAMPTFDNLELRYISIKKVRCPWWVRICLRLFFGGLTFFIAVAFPFLPSLGPLIGAITLPLTLAYPSFMWILMKKNQGNVSKWWVNLVLGCLGIVLSGILVFGASWNLATRGLNANFFRP